MVGGHVSKNEGERRRLASHLAERGSTSWRHWLTVFLGTSVALALFLRTMVVLDAVGPTFAVTTGIGLVVGLLLARVGYRIMWRRTRTGR
jgi:hypothetical protein